MTPPDYWSSPIWSAKFWSPSDRPSTDLGNKAIKFITELVFFRQFWKPSSLNSPALTLFLLQLLLGFCQKGFGFSFLWHVVARQSVDASSSVIWRPAALSTGGDFKFGSVWRDIRIGDDKAVQNSILWQDVEKLSSDVTESLITQPRSVSQDLVRVWIIILCWIKFVPQSPPLNKMRLSWASEPAGKYLPSCTRGRSSLGFKD